ncbi:MAG: 30S ribosomal protein S5 [Alphaproteobacteria bacterium]|nr:30S ribosomal protein S5 [Alphaproteobacteria bacterium]
MAENEIQEKKRRPRKDREADVKVERAADEFTDRVIHVNRVSKTVKGGKRFAFAALVVVGDQKGRLGFAHAKAKEVPDAIKKATERARRNLIRVPLREGRTLHHDVLGSFGAGHVTLRTAPAGTGIIAGGPMRAIFEVMGIQDVVAKCTGSSNPHNMVRATFNALTSLYSPRTVAAKRGKKVGDIVSRRDGAVAKDAE